MFTIVLKLESYLFPMNVHKQWKNKKRKGTKIPRDKGKGKVMSFALPSWSK